METSKTNLGADHLLTLTSMAHLAFMWKTQGQSVEAIDLLRQSVQLCQHVLGDNRPDLLSSLGALKQWEAERLEKLGELEDIGSRGFAQAHDSTQELCGLLLWIVAMDCCCGLLLWT